MANELGAVSTLNFSAPQLAHSKLRGACLNLASAPTDERAERFYRHFDFNLDPCSGDLKSCVTH
jgi:hypothetical protein